MDHYQKKGKSISSDQKQFAEYTKILGRDAPKNFVEFQDLKYSDPEKCFF